MNDIDRRKCARPQSCPGPVFCNLRVCSLDHCEMKDAEAALFRPKSVPFVTALARSADTTAVECAR
jgi:hypothetical protein